MSKYVIETKNLSKQYGPQKSVSGLDLHVREGRIYGLLGRNGAGKTTTMKLLLGLTQSTWSTLLSRIKMLLHDMGEPTTDMCCSC